MKKIISLFTYLFVLLVLGGCIEDPDTITVQTVSSTDIEYNSAVLHGKLTIKGAPIIKEKGFFYGTAPNPTLRVQVSGSSSDNSASVPFAVQIKDLSENTRYYFQAYAINGNNQIIKGEEFSFVTKPEPSVTIDYLSMKSLGMNSNYVSEYEMKGEATLRYDGYEVAHAGFIFSAYQGLNASDVTSNGTAHKIQCEIKGDKITLDITTADLNNISRVGSTYFIAYMILENGMVVTSETRKVSIYDVNGEAQAITVGAEEISYDSAKLNGRLRLTGNAVFTEYGFFYGTVSTPNVKVKANGGFTGPDLNYSLNINKLMENTKYYFQSYGIDIQGNTVKGEVLTFNTRKQPTINITAASLTILGMDSNYLTRYNIKGSATLNPEGYTVKEAGFLYSGYYGINASTVENPGTSSKVPCEINNNKISLDIEAKNTNSSNNFYGDSTYILAYMILSDGTIFVSETQKISGR